MTIKSSDFDLSFSYGNDLTEKPNDPKSFHEGILHLEKVATKEKDKLKKGKLFSLIGSHYRICGDNSMSEKYLLRALSLIDKSKNKSEYFVATLRLAHTFQKQKKFDLSLQLFNELKILCDEEEGLNGYSDFLFQHIGKLNFDQKKYKAALSNFERARELRLSKGDRELLASTDLAIQITKGKLKEK